MADYLRDPDEIYRRSFATIRGEADLSGLPPDVADVAIRLIHACGMTEPHTKSPRKNNYPFRGVDAPGWQGARDRLVADDTKAAHMRGSRARSGALGSPRSSRVGFGA